MVIGSARRQRKIHEDRLNRPGRARQIDFDIPVRRRIWGMDGNIHAHCLGLARSRVGDPLDSVGFKRTVAANLNGVAWFDTDLGRGKREARPIT